jgi:hypothetical protein
VLEGRRKFKAFEQHLEKVVDEIFVKKNNLFMKWNFELKIDWHRQDNRNYSSAIDVIATREDLQFTKHYEIVSHGNTLSVSDFVNDLNQTLNSWLAEIRERAA